MEDTHIETLQKYKQKLERKREVYQVKYKNDPEFKRQNRERAKAHYHKNKQTQSALKLYRWYVRNKSIEELWIITQKSLF